MLPRPQPMQNMWHSRKGVCLERIEKRVFKN
jgi:hypothetical protein